MANIGKMMGFSSLPFLLEFSLKKWKPISFSAFSTCSAAIATKNFSTMSAERKEVSGNGEVKASSNSNKNYAKLVADLRATFDTGRTLPLSHRKQQLKGFLKMIEENSDAFHAAVAKDMRKAKFEGRMYETLSLQNDIKGVLRDIDEWVKPEKIPYNLLLTFDRAFIHNEPFGVVLIIGAWNYPILLTLQPLIGAISAGNCAVIKPSENSPNTSAKIAELIPKYLDPDCYKVVEGNAPDTINLLEQKFDYIFATSSTQIGKSVMQAAAKNLTPVTLELGGKSPVYIDDSADFELATKRILWGKLINIGQTCIAPDYILCSKKSEKAFITIANNVLKEFYGDDCKASPDITRIINTNHFKRLSKLLEETKGKVVLGGDKDSDDKWIHPTLVVDVKETDSLMSEEIFGPILPFMTVNSAQEALKFVKSRAKPLALYVFSQDQKVLDLFIEKSSSGAVCCNDVIVQNAWEGLPFGGVGDSGTGSYHGKYSFEAFTHKKSVVVRNFSKAGEAMSAIRYPPYSAAKMKALTAALTNMRFFKMRPQAVKYLLSFILGLCTSFALSWMLI